jgi:hypothetical protein
MENFERLSAKFTRQQKLLKRKNNETPILVFLFCGFAVTAKTVLLKNLHIQISRICKNTIH